MFETLSVADIEALARDCLLRTRVAPGRAATVAAEVARSEATGETGHGLQGLLRDIRLIRYGKLQPDAEPQMTEAAASVLNVDAKHGFASVAIEAARDRIIPMARSQGIAALYLQQASDPGAMLLPVETLAEAGLLAFGFAASGPAKLAHPKMMLPMAIALGGSRPEATPKPEADDPLQGPPSHQAWMIVLDPKAADPAVLNVEAWQMAKPVDIQSRVDVPQDLIAELAGA